MKAYARRLLIVIFFSTTTTLICSLVASVPNTLDPNRPLNDGEILVSASGSFVLGFFSPAGSTSRYVGVWYGKVEVQTVVWVANRQVPIKGSTGTLSISAATGSLSITDNNSTLVWSTPTANLTHPVAQLLDDGNLVVKEADVEDPGRYAWQSFDHPTDTMLAGMKFGWDLRTGLNRNLTSWRSASDPSPGPYALSMDVRGVPETFLWNGEKRVWRTGPWDGLRLSGVPDMNTIGLFTFDQVTDRDEVYYRFWFRNSSVVSRFAVDPTGTLERHIWSEAKRSWTVFWSAPKDRCDSISTCGPYGVCDIEASPICSCLQGFDPKSPENWALWDGTEGCVRRTALDCRNGTDGFVRIPAAKQPDTTFAAVDRSSTLDQCRSKCMSNCSCNAYASVNISGGGSGSGCIIWTAEITDLRIYRSAGQDLYVRLAAADLELTSFRRARKRSAVRKAGIVIGSSIVGALLLLIGYFMWKKKKVADTTTEIVEEEELELPLFNLAMIIAATDNFGVQNKLGEGGFGCVYMGKMRDGQQIAVKRLAKTSSQGNDEFKNEVALIAKLQHRNLVKLLGCCIEGEERMLVYEYMDNKSLDVFLFDKEKSALLDWYTRHNIIIGIARGLLYLHQDSRFRIIHRDLKASNILLDKNMNPKISDFGLARIFDGDESEANTSKVVGTYGYMSPEYAMDGVFSVKSDVYSYGVLMIEVITGKKNRGSSNLFEHYHRNLLGYAWNLWTEGKGLELVDESIIHSFSIAQAFKCIVVGLLCVQEQPEDRPTMSSVVLMLGSEGVPLATPKRPGFVISEGPLVGDLSINKQESWTITILEGR